MPDSASFVHLHVHTEYSLLDGMIKSKKLLAKAQQYAMPAVAMTDHGNMHGVVEFYQAAQKMGGAVKPILGCEVYVAQGSRLNKKTDILKNPPAHLTLLAENNTGYANLVRLTSAAFLEGFHDKPRVDKELLAAHASGLICLSGCLRGEIPQAIEAGNLALARELVAQYRDIFGPGNFFLELHDHGLEAQLRVNRALRELSSEFGLPLVAANDVHFLNADQREAHDAMICIGTNRQVFDEKRVKYPEEVYFKSAEQMREIFREIPEACDNTLRIAERCNVTLDFKTNHYPNFVPPDNKTHAEYLRELCYDGLARRFGPERAASDTTLSVRLDYELEVLGKTGFLPYFLIVWDFIAHAKRNGIPVGPGRGSAAGALVAYVLEITDVDPLRFGLVFERFMNPERVSPPDIDIDFCQTRRPEVIEYVRDKYGHRSVSHIVTFGTMGAKSVIRDVARVLSWSYGDADRIAKMIPTELGINLRGAYDKNPELKAIVDGDSATKQLWELALQLEGMVRGTGIHAAGIVISDRDIDTIVPLCVGGDGEVVTQYEMAPLTDLGMLKMDFLGLKTLTVIQDAVALIHLRDPSFDLQQIPFDEKRTFELLARGETIGVFQLESGGMTSLCRQLGIDRIDDILALIALYRPGPMDLIPDYIKRKRGAKFRYEHPLLEQVCADTYGIMIYQEQVQRAANVLAGYTLGQADLLRRAMGKKDKEKMAQERVKFVKGCRELNNIAEDKANEIFDLLEKFAGYGFNKSHSAAYALVSYHTAYLKALWPVEFLCGLMGNEIGNTDKLATFVSESIRMGVRILPPDVNYSDLKFVPEADDTGSVSIRFGLAAIKNVGEQAMQSALADRRANGNFAGLEDFCARLDSKVVHKKNMESLIKSGAFDFTGRNRAEMFAALDSVMGAASAIQRDRATGQVSLFDALDPAPAPARSGKTSSASSGPAWKPWPASEKLSYEKELLGVYLSGHPLEEHRHVLENPKFTAIGKLIENEGGSYVIAGALGVVSKKFSKTDGKPFAILTIEDLTGGQEVMVWSDAFAKSSALLIPGKIVGIKGRLSRKGEEIRFTADEIKDLTAALDNSPVKLYLRPGRDTPADLDHLAEIIRRHPGTRTVELHFPRLALRAAPAWRLRLNPESRAHLAPWLAP